MIKRWLQLLIVCVALSNAFARPKDDVFPVFKKDEVSKESSEVTIHPTTEDASVLTTTANVPEKLTIDDIATVARATSGDPSLNPSLVKVTGQLMDTIGQMVEKDTRTPPKLKEALKEKDTKNETTEASLTTASGVDKVEANGKFQVRDTNLSADLSEGKASKKDDVIKGVAVPVIMDEDLDSPPKKLQKIPNVTKPLKEEKKKLATTVKPVRESPTTTPSSGLSTWILLSDNREATTPTTTKKKTGASTTKKPQKSNPTTVKTTTAKLVRKTTPKPEKKSEPVSALETMVKNQKTTTASRPNPKKKDGSENKEKQSESKKVVTIPPVFAIIDTTEATATDISNTEVIPETTTKKKKSSSKKRKKNKKKKKPAEKSGSDQVIKDIVKQPKQPVGAQFYNFLSREIMPTVGLGLVGVLVTAGLAGLLGYNPFVGANLPVRRTYESQHGYNPHGSYYNYNSEYSDADGGKNEEVLFREVLSGMPEDSRYGMPHADASYPEAQLYSSQEQAYDAAKNPQPKGDSKDRDSYSDTYGTQYDSYSSKEQVGSKYPVYSGSGYEYDRSTTEKYKASAKYNEDETIEKQPEALYRVSSGYNSEGTEPEGTNSDTAWHRIGTPMDYPSQAALLEPGPRRLDLDKMTEKLTDGSEHKRSKRSPEGILARLVRRSNEVVNINLEDEKENEIDVDDGPVPFSAASTTENNISETTVDSTTEYAASSTTDEGKQPSLIESFPSEATPTTETSPSLMDVLRRLAQFKLKLGINFLKATTEAFGKYLEGVQQRVEDSMANDTSFPAMRYAWLGRDAPSWDDNSKVREKRYQRNAEQTYLLDEADSDDGDS